MIRSAPAASEGPDVDPEDGLVILYTSGTTGLPKGALISHRAEIARMALLRMDLRATEEDGFVAWAPMFHMGSDRPNARRAHVRRNRLCCRRLRSGSDR